MSRFNVGNKVKIVDPGRRYSSYESFFTDNKIPYKYALRYQFEAVLSPFDMNGEENKEYRVVAMAEGRCLIEAINSVPRVYLFDEAGLEFAEAPEKMTLKQVCEALGKRIEIVEEVEEGDE